MTTAANLALAVGALAVGGLAFGTYAGVREPIGPVFVIGEGARATGSPTALAIAQPTAAGEPAAAAPTRAAPTRAAPTLAAPDLAATDARAAREALVARIRDPGHGREAWHAPARAILDTIGARAIGATDTGCYMAGCTATFTFANDALVAAAIASAPAYAAWTGAAHVTPPEHLATGDVVVAVVLERPD